MNTTQKRKPATLESLPLLNAELFPQDAELFYLLAMNCVGCSLPAALFAARLFKCVPTAWKKRPQNMERTESLLIRKFKWKPKRCLGRSNRNAIESERAKNVGEGCLSPNRSNKHSKYCVTSLHMLDVPNSTYTTENAVQHLPQRNRAEKFFRRICWQPGRKYDDSENTKKYNFSQKEASAIRPGCAFERYGSSLARAHKNATCHMHPHTSSFIFAIVNIGLVRPMNDVLIVWMSCQWFLEFGHIASIHFNFQWFIFLRRDACTSHILIYFCCVSCLFRMPSIIQWVIFTLLIEMPSVAQIWAIAVRLLHENS